MKNWSTVLWLLLFFPIGLYLMFTQTDWSKRTKYLLSAVCGVLVILLIASGFILESLLLSGVLVLATGLISTVTAFIRKKEFRTSIAVLFAGLLLFGFSYQQIEARTQKEIAYAEQLRVEEEIRIEKEIQQKLLAESVSAVEKAEQKTDRTTYQDALILVSQLKQKDNNLENRLKVIDQQLTAQEEIKAAVTLVEKAEQEKTRGRYEEALQAIDALKTEQADLIKRLVEVEKVVAADEQKVTEATDSLVQAENSKSRTDYEKASLLVTSLPRQDSGLSKRLETLDSNIQVEENRIMETERVAEEKRIAEEKARAVEEARLLAEQQAAVAAAQAQEDAATVVANDYSGGTYVDENGEGTIKGSVNGIYHTPGSTYYSRTVNVVEWFKSIEEAETSGYRAPKR